MTRYVLTSSGGARPPGSTSVLSRRRLPVLPVVLALVGGAGALALVVWLPSHLTGEHQLDRGSSRERSPGGWWPGCCWRSRSWSSSWRGPRPARWSSSRGCRWCSCWPRAAPRSVHAVGDRGDDGRLPGRLDDAARAAQDLPSCAPRRSSPRASASTAFEAAPRSRLRRSAPRQGRPSSCWVCRSCVGALVAARRAAEESHRRQLAALQRRAGGAAGCCELSAAHRDVAGAPRHRRAPPVRHRPAGGGDRPAGRRRPRGGEGVSGPGA